MVAADIAIIIAAMIIIVIIAGCVRIVAIVMERSMAIANIVKCITACLVVDNFSFSCLVFLCKKLRTILIRYVV